MIAPPLTGGDALAEYVSRYRRADLPPLEVGMPLDLFPALPIPAGISPQLTWKNPWPFGDRAGVYLIYSDSFELLYIGKASMNRSLGYRLYDYFGGGPTCILKSDSWKQAPRFVVNIAVPTEMPFEAPALEEFLIRKLNPSTNVCGI
jgi:hypothetical protein